MKDTLIKWHNQVQMFFWVSLLGSTIYFWQLRSMGEYTQAASFMMKLVFGTQLAQILQFGDFLVPGSFVAKLLQLSGRFGVAWFILPNSHNMLHQVMVLTLWSFGDFFRYNYYNSKSTMAGHLRYNVFIVVYPLGLFGEFLNIYDCYSNGYLPGLGWSLTHVWALYAIMMIGWAQCYVSVFKQRIKFYRDLRRKPD